MLKAIHKETEKIVSAVELIRKPEWYGKEKDNFIAPHPEIENWNELKERGIYE